jgi:hypothetical protein
MIDLLKLHGFNVDVVSHHEKEGKKLLALIESDSSVEMGSADRV